MVVQREIVPLKVNFPHEMAAIHIVLSVSSRVVCFFLVLSRFWQVTWKHWLRFHKLVCGFVFSLQNFTQNIVKHFWLYQAFSTGQHILSCY